MKIILFIFVLISISFLVRFLGGWDMLMKSLYCGFYKNGRFST